MKVIILTILTLFLQKGFSQTKPIEEIEDFTCYHVDESNIHCYLEDSDADLDFNNDGILDRKYNQYELDHNLSDDDDTGIIDHNGLIQNKYDTLYPQKNYDYELEDDDGVIQHDQPYKDLNENDVGL